MQEAPDPDDPSSRLGDRYGRTGYSRADVRIHPSLKDLAAGFIRQEIVSGRLSPGAKVDQDEIAEELGISRLPIREALIELTAKGFVTAVPRRGAFVAILEVEDIEDHFEVLGMLFRLSGTRATGKIDETRLGELRRLHKEISASADIEVIRDLNHEFYRIINEVGSSRRVLLTLQHLWLSLPNDLYSGSSAFVEVESAYRGRVLAALEAHDSKSLGRLMQEHLRECGRVTIEELRSRGYWADEAAIGQKRRR